MKRKRTNLTRILTASLIYLELIVVAVIVIYPLIWIVGSSFGSSKGLANASAIPDHATLRNYIDLFRNTDFPVWYMNTLKVAAANMFFGVLLSTLGAYAFSRFKFKGKKASLLSILILQMFPAFLTAIAVYMLFLNFGLLDSLTGLVFVGVAAQLPYNIWLLKGYLDNISTSFDEAALIDGASRTQIFVRIIVPLATPMLTFVAVLQFAAPWMDFILPRLLISSEEKKTVAIGLYSMISDQTKNEFTLFAAGSVLIAIPIAVLYIVLQKYLINGLTAGGDKG
ncbi:carbohydrate ABC transporter membrane protein 2 (CUT1 family) [Paenibacillus cellulosilyticus]|uniref:Carbohydrate ABC transporter membrane protein 2 (CUT1 family) n=1 Tax=Paenibacillus cellulosilyticus TaxID=375489 RepID=A0A2V2YVC0_9BACL|nr:sugar ABC transporter permease [Paenibacillus cellulosilyticus]PWW05088.1 carbohydrate ABC transporter membrane protein 2 (CUT1 family) [Paenibacillus cellulosilyticus]QKS48640.1 sugar ABC transporter permease [Paenibacillus cellulosilyticus]